jgi:hypothetical protein
MNGKNVEGFQGHRIVAAQHVLIAQQIGQVRRERMPDTLIFDGGNGLSAQLKAKQLTRVEKIPVSFIPPAVQSVRLVAGKNGLFRNKTRRDLRP